MWLCPRSTPTIIYYKQNFESHRTSDLGPTSSFLLTRVLHHFSCIKFTHHASSTISRFSKAEGELRLLGSSKDRILLGFLEPSASQLLYWSCPNLIQLHFLFEVICLSKAFAFSQNIPLSSRMVYLRIINYITWSQCQCDWHQRVWKHHTDLWRAVTHVVFYEQEWATRDQLTSCPVIWQVGETSSTDQELDHGRQAIFLWVKMEGTWESWRLSRTGVGKRWPRIKMHVRNTLEILSHHRERFCQMTGAEMDLFLRMLVTDMWENTSENLRVKGPTWQREAGKMKSPVWVM